MSTVIINQHVHHHHHHRAQHLEAKLSTAETHIDTLEQQVASLRQENKTLVEQSATDQASRKRADDTRTWADAERSRLQRSRDELALKVKVGDVTGGEREEWGIEGEGSGGLRGREGRVGG